MSRTRRPPHVNRGLSEHILPTSGTMVGVCVTLVGLVKIAEGKIGPSHVDQYAGATSLFFLASALTSYLSIRTGERPERSARYEAAADVLFLVGLTGITVIAVLFGYEVI